MSRHTALLGLPDVLRGFGLNVVVSDGWEEGQCKGNDHYLWTDPQTKAGSHSNPPSGYMVHHSGAAEPTSATIPPVGTSKAGAWIVLMIRLRISSPPSLIGENRLGKCWDMS